MKILITAGGTSEYIDSVRKITNTGTGRLSALIYKAFLDSFKSIEIDYIKTHEAVMPEIDRSSTRVHTIVDTSDLKTCVDGLAEDKHFDVIIHCMAVSDFYVDKACEIDELVDHIDKLRQSVSAEDFAGDLKKLLRGAGVIGKPKKLSSKKDVYLSLKRTPKIIENLRKQHPRAALVGFKLLDQVTEEELLSVGNALGEKHKCELVIANDKSRISGQEHHAIFIKNGQIIRRASNKQMIAKTLVEYIKEKLERGQ